MKRVLIIGYIASLYGSQNINKGEINEKEK